MHAQASFPLAATVLLGMGVVFVFLVFLSAMMAALTAVGRRSATPADSAPPGADPAGPGSPGWIAAATAAFLAAEQAARPAADRLPSAAAWRPYDTADAVRWRLGTVPAYRGRASERPATP